MPDLDAVREAIHRGFDHVDDLGGGILRGERRYDDKPFVVAYIDLADEVVARSQNLTDFQEKLLGASFFSPGNDLRWNSYLYFLAGPKSTHDARYPTAKAHIESDRHFARKFVVTEKDLSLRLGAGPSSEPNDGAVQQDIGATWWELLRAGGLGVLLEQRPRTKALELISTGAAFQAETRSAARPVGVHEDPLQSGLLRSLTVGHFRLVNEGKSFKFGDVNLIFGPNGTGKTSLLEAIEALYCGRVRRDPDAGFSGLKAEIELPTGKRVSVSGTTAVAVLKARNLSWYGRPDPLSSAITQGFTRFNFLDTDAAFRLSSEPDPDQIKQDLGKLLVGAETSKLWNYLSKLEEEVRDKLVALKEKLPTLRRQSDFLAAEVKRLRGTPTEATALAKSYQSSLVALGAKWLTEAGGTVVSPEERSRLESLSRGIGQVLSAMQATPVTRSALRARSLSLRSALAAVRQLRAVHTQTLARLSTADRLVRERQQNIGVLEQWHRYCEAGVPEVASKLQSTQLRIAPLRAALSGVSVETLPELPGHYAPRLINDAIAAARRNLDIALQDERSASQALAQRQHVGQSLAILRRDLHDASIAFVEKTGDESSCPVCGTLHGPAELLAKIEALVAGEDAAQADGLRQAIQSAKERVDKRRKTVDLLALLLSYSMARGASEDITCAALKAEFLERRTQLCELLQEMRRLNAATDSLSLTVGLEWANYEPARDAARRILPIDVSPTDVIVVGKALESQRAAHVYDSRSAEELRKQAAALVVQIGDKLGEVSLSPPTISDPATSVTLVERRSKQMEDALAFAAGAAEQIGMSEERSFEELQAAVDQALAAFDKASHAARGEEQAQSDLKKKLVELEQSKATVERETKIEQNYAKAKAVLSRLVAEHSLDKATKDALMSIRGRVSDVFARIHSPHEYELGEFEEGRLLLTREQKQPHGVDQVSTGQRAAFALSIFLALNGSAKSAPPIVLIDDPVAHLDDLNALSFLDFLRDLVMSSGKQVFFGTADARLAALFQRKFEFLGRDRFRRITLYR